MISALPILPVESILEIFKYIPTRNLCRLMVLSRTFNIEIKKMMVERFNETFWNKHRRLLVFMTTYLSLDPFLPPLHNTHNGYDLTFDKLDKDLVATFVVDLSQPDGTIGPNHTKLWGLRLRSNDIIRDPLNKPISYPKLDLDLPSEPKEARVYIFDSDTDRDHPFISAFYVTKGCLRASNNNMGCIKKTLTTSSDNNNNTNNSTINTKNKLFNTENAEGWWKHDLISRRHKNFPACAHFIGKNESNNDDVIEMLHEVRISAPMLLTAAEEKRKDKGDGGVEFLVVEGGQSSLTRSCIIL
ncbi:475_t:CDS:2 [Ambispora leptoticha]|uniref:475_t:CDS:1 n=1 Tax=Ambispora leptoticha TaxID=144679 RepID=A0A9N8ZN10_9GLOM|nr:475_t:CDS:2 [Ambispora leptoticha]